MGGACDSRRCNFWGDPGACSPEKILENLDCPRLHYARFYSGESEQEKKEYSS